MKVWTKGLLTYIEDDRIPVVKKILETVMTLTDIQASYILLGPDNILYAVCQDAVIYYLELNECIPGMEILIDGNTTFAKDIVENTDPNIKTKTVKVSSYGLADNQAIIITDLSILADIKSKVDLYYNTVKQFTPFASLHEANKTDEEFKKLLEVKADQGARFYNSIDFSFPVFTGFPNVNKADLVDVNIYKYPPDPDTYSVMEYTVYKKKINKNLHIIYRTLNLQLQYRKD